MATSLYNWRNILDNYCSEQVWASEWKEQQQGGVHVQVLYGFEDLVGHNNSDSRDTEVWMKVVAEGSGRTEVTRVREKRKAKFYSKCIGLLPINLTSYQEVVYLKKNLAQFGLSTPKDFMICPPSSEKRGVSKITRTFGHPVWRKQTLRGHRDSNRQPR